MDSQDNIILAITRFDSIKDFLIPIPDKPNKSILFSINEYDGATLTNNSDKYDIFIENLEDGGEIKLSQGEKVIINDYDHPYPPMEYRIRILNKITGRSDLYLYKIAHTKSTNDSQYKEMVEAIGQYDENLLYEKDVKFLSGKRIYNSAYRSLYTLFDLIISNKNLILNSLNTIYINPLLKDKRIVVKTNTFKRQTSRSIIKNARSPRGDTVYYPKMLQYTDFPLSKYLVYMLIVSKNEIIKLVDKASFELTKTNEKLERILANSSSDPLKRKKHTNYQIDVFNKRITVLNDFLDSSKMILINIDKILTSDSFKDVEPSSKRDNSIVYYAHYLNVERRLYLPLLQGFAFSFANNYSSILMSPIKQTSKLFEAYCLLTIDAAITELGFEAIDEEIDYEHFVKRFVRNDYEFELYYSIDAKDVSIVKKNEIYSLGSDTRHISPDFFLILKKEDAPLCFLVFDAKCRKAEYVHRDIEEGKYEKSIREYLSLRYSIDDNPFFLPKIVDSLWLLFPEDEHDAQFEKINQLEYRFVKLAMNGDEENFIDKFEDFISLYLD